MQIKDVEKLKAWLLVKLEPLCDADPAALAKYVVALLRKDKPKSALRELCIDQLEVFLAKETTLFVDRLFRGLESESYLTGHDSKTPPPVAPPIATPPNSNSPTARLQVSKAPPMKSTSPKPQPVNVPLGKQQSAKPPVAEAGDGTATLSAGSGSGDRSGVATGEKGKVGGGSGDRRRSEDPRSREVDDDDRDFRRSRNRGVRSMEGRARGTRGGVTVSREPDSSTGGGRRGVESAVGRGRGTVLSTSGAKRRRGEGEGVSSTGGPPGEGARRTKPGVWPEERSSHGNVRSVRRSWQHRSRSRSRSSSTDSSSSTASSRDHGRKRSRQEWSERGSSSRAEGSGGKRPGKSGEGGADGEMKDEGKRQRCKDYDEKGFCMLGDQCPFDHGVDPVVIGNNIPHTYPPPPSMVGIPSLTLTKPGFLVPGPGRISPTESTTDGYNPEEPALTATTTSPSSVPSFLPAPLLNPTPLLPQPFPPPTHHHTHPPHIQRVPTLPPIHHIGPFPPPPLPPHITNTTHHFPPPSHSNWPRPPQQLFPSMPRHPSDALIVRKIPRESNTITKLSGHFEKFGTIVNLTVWYGGDPEGALVQFSTPFEARRAHDSAEAVLNNRFIKIYYLRKDMPYTTLQPREPHIEHNPSQDVARSIGGHTPSLTHLIPKSVTTTSGTSPTLHTHSPHIHPPHKSHQSTPASPQTKLPPSTRSSAHSYVSAASTAPHTTPHTQQRKRKAAETPESKEMTRKRLELQKKTGELLQKQIDQQKLLISKLEKGGKQMPVEEKKKIMKTLKSLSVSILKMKNMASEAMEPRPKSATQPSPSSPAFPPTSPTSPSLVEKAQALRQEAHQLGLISSPSQPISQTTPTSKGSHVTGSGGHQKKDLRAVLNQKQKSLLVINAESREQLTAHFDTFGGLMKVEMDPENSKNLIFSFRNAHLAQKAAKHSSLFNGKPLIMKWYTPKSSTPSPYYHIPRVTPSPVILPPSSLPLSTSPSPSITVATPTDHTEQVTTPTLATPTLTKLDPEELHLVEDDEEEESEGRSWRR